MFDTIRAGRWRYAPREVFYPEPVTLPEDHPCLGCPVLSLEAGKPYCFLPKCRRELFVSEEGEPFYDENPEAATPAILV